MTLTEQIHPRHGPNLSPMFVALLGFLIQEKLTNPEIVALAITSDGHLLAMVAGEVGFNDYIGLASDFWRNLEGWCKACELAPDQCEIVRQQAEGRIQYH